MRLRTVISHSNIRDDLLQNGLALYILLVLVVSLLEFLQNRVNNSILKDRELYSANLLKILDLSSREELAVHWCNLI